MHSVVVEVDHIDGCGISFAENHPKPTPIFSIQALVNISQHVAWICLLLCSIITVEAKVHHCDGLKHRDEPLPFPTDIDEFLQWELHRYGQWMNKLKKSALRWGGMEGNYWSGYDPMP